MSYSRRQRHTNDSSCPLSNLAGSLEIQRQYKSFNTFVSVVIHDMDRGFREGSALIGRPGDWLKTIVPLHRSVQVLNHEHALRLPRAILLDADV